MRPVIIIGSCRAFEVSNHNEAIRRTWLAQNHVPYFFALGQGGGPVEKDCRVFDVDDSYLGLTAKMIAARKHALDTGHDWIFQCYADTYVYSARLMRCGFEQFDYYGHFPLEGLATHELATPGCYASGGPGYWLSEKASRILVEEQPDHWAEDLWCGRVMKKHGLRGAHDQRFLFKGGWTKGAITSHLSQGPGNYHPQWMAAVHMSRMGER